jgi:endonuclease/exonuclease/phosphatase family metal-dependent hydrolase
VSVLRVVSYNIHKCIGGRDRRYDFDRVLEVIAQESPDIVCLQEVDREVARSRFHDQPQMFAERLAHATHLYQMNVHLKQGGYGNLVLSRWPLHGKHQISLRMRYKKPRGAQLAVVETPAGLLHVVNWHLGLAEGEREWQARHLLAHPSFNEAADLPTLIIGDTNDWRNRLGPRVFQPAGFEQITNPPSRFRSFPAYLRIASLDKAFCRGPITIRHVAVPQHQLAMQASDHLPLVVDLELHGPPALATAGD